MEVSCGTQRDSQTPPPLFFSSLVGRALSGGNEDTTGALPLPSASFQNPERLLLIHFII